jgi:hypothetical protein
MVVISSLRIPACGINLPLIDLMAGQDDSEDSRDLRRGTGKRADVPAMLPQQMIDQNLMPR